MAPDFESTTQDGERITLDSLRGGRTILYFYPKDNTSGCTLEAKSLRDGREQLAEMGFRIVGVSPDSEKSHRNFCDKHDLGFTLLADTDRSVCEAFRSVGGEVDVRPQVYGRGTHDIHPRRRGAHREDIRQSGYEEPLPTDNRFIRKTIKTRYPIMADKQQINADKLKVLSAVMEQDREGFRQGLDHAHVESGRNRHTGNTDGLDNARHGARRGRIPQRSRDRDIRPRVVG